MAKLKIKNLITSGCNPLYAVKSWRFSLNCNARGSYPLLSIKLTNFCHCEKFCHCEICFTNRSNPLLIKSIIQKFNKLINSQNNMHPRKKKL